MRDNTSGHSRGSGVVLAHQKRENFAIRVKGLRFGVETMLVTPNPQSSTLDSLDTADLGWDDQSALTALVCAGADLDQPRHVLHYLYVLSEDAAYLAATEMSAAGWFVEIDAPESGDPDWLVLAQDLSSVLTPGRVLETRVFFQRLANKYVGEYDGWEASV